MAEAILVKNYLDIRSHRSNLFYLFVEKILTQKKYG